MCLKSSVTGALGVTQVSRQLGMGKGPKRTLELVNYRLESRPLTDPRLRSLGLDLDSTQNRARQSHIMQ